MEEEGEVGEYGPEGEFRTYGRPEEETINGQEESQLMFNNIVNEQPEMVEESRRGRNTMMEEETAFNPEEQTMFKPEEEAMFRPEEEARFRPEEEAMYRPEEAMYRP